MFLKLILTEDGSHTLFNSRLNETYHSKFGAINESKHVFINAGLEEISKNKIEAINILEVGFGAGLNAYLTYLFSEQKKHRINYLALEPFPLSMEILNQLNYDLQLLSKSPKVSFGKFHHAEWGRNVVISDHFNLHKITSNLESFSYDSDYFQLVYFDAFAPDIQPELWTLEVFRKIYDLLEPGGIVVTYSAKGLVRRNLQQAGFLVERLTGPTGKREMLRGVKN
ncbi:MAG: tRNA (5-methylaminomethyl-2-thiouridine)(34)-methyltransferase MnmD [Bacteroidales bacterium]|nr:tRNA (5-methylaminomethyl-2-thiouridine)(34)-methyltransferase MnmD [Bacteroidales bacterium]